MQKIFPILRYSDARAAIQWLCSAFGFVEMFSVPESGQVVRHAQLKLGANVIDFEIAKKRIETLPSALAEQSAALTFLCNPNAPSGTLVSLQQIEKLARSLPGVLVIDEAYVDFAGSEGVSSIPLIQRLPNLVVLRTFSKSFSLAGMRIGLAFASEHIISGMMKVKDSYNVNRLSLIAATAALQDLPWMTRNARRIQRTRKRLTTGLVRVGYDVYPSHANFVLARKSGRNQKGVYDELKRRKILVRYFDIAGLQDCLRITVGTNSEVQTLLREMSTIES